MAVLDSKDRTLIPNSTGRSATMPEATAPAGVRHRPLGQVLNLDGNTLLVNWIASTGIEDQPSIFTSVVRAAPLAVVVK